MRVAVLHWLTDIDWPGVRDWLVAFGTLAAASAAIYIGIIRQHPRRPFLSLTFDASEDIDAQVVGI